MEGLFFVVCPVFGVCTLYDVGVLVISVTNHHAFIYTSTHTFVCPPHVYLGIVRGQPWRIIVSFDAVTCALHWDCCSPGVHVQAPAPGHEVWNLVISSLDGDWYVGLTVAAIDQLVHQLSVARAALL